MVHGLFKIRYHQTNNLTIPSYIQSLIFLPTSGTYSLCLGLDHSLFPPIKSASRISFFHKGTCMTSLSIPDNLLTNRSTLTSPDSITHLLINVLSLFTKKYCYTSHSEANIGDEVKKSLLRPGAIFPRFVASPQLPFWDSIGQAPFFL